jgi:hypothetical protein
MYLTRSATTLIVLIRYSIASEVAMLYATLCILFGESDSPASVPMVYAVAATSAAPAAIDAAVSSVM